MPSRMPLRGARIAAPCALLLLSIAAATAGEAPAAPPRQATPGASRQMGSWFRLDFWAPSLAAERVERAPSASEIEPNDGRIPQIDFNPLGNTDEIKKVLLGDPRRKLPTPLPWLEDDPASAPDVGLGLSTRKAVLPSGFVPIPQVKAAHDFIAVENTKGVDRFARTLFRRPELQGLPFTLDPDCTLPVAKAKRFDRAATLVQEHFTNSLQGVMGEARAEWASYEQALQEIAKEPQPHFESEDLRVSARIAALMQIMAPESEELQRGLIRHLKKLNHRDAARSLAKLAIFSEETSVRNDAIAALKTRPGSHYDEVIRLGLRYPRPEIAKRTMDLIAKRDRFDWADALVDLLDEPDPRSPKDAGDGKTFMVRELVKIRHHTNCLLCHPPARRGPEIVDLSKLDFELLEEFAASPQKSIPTAGEGGSGWGGPSGFQQVPSIRFDVTFLRQDFSLKLLTTKGTQILAPESRAELERFDFLVRSRKLTAAQAKEYERRLASDSGTHSPYRRAAEASLRQLTKRDVAPTAEAWRAVVAELR